MRGLASLVAKNESRTWNDGGSQWFTSGSPTTVTQWTAFNLSAVWACATLIADAIATLPVGTFRKDGETRRATDAPYWLANPNPLSDRLDYDTQRILSLLLWGNAYTLLVRKDGSLDPAMPIVERWLLNPGHVQARRVVAYDERSELVYWVRGEPIPRQMIQHIRGYTPPGFFLGMSVIDQARRGLDMTAAAELAGKNLYDQGMHQSGVLEVPALPSEVSKEVTDRLRDTVMERHAGSGNAGKPMVLTGGTTWKPAMLTPSDAQYLETRKFQINEICRWFRVSPHLVQDIVAHASQGGGNGIEQQATEFAQYTLMPWVRRLESQDSPLTPRGQYVQYDLEAAVRADIATQNESFAAGRNGGWYSANDVRAAKNLPPIDNGSIYLQPVNYAEAGTQPTGPPVTMPSPEPAAVPAQGAN